MAAPEGGLGWEWGGVLLSEESYQSGCEWQRQLLPRLPWMGSRPQSGNKSFGFIMLTKKKEKNTRRTARCNIFRL